MNARLTVPSSPSPSQQDSLQAATLEMAELLVEEFERLLVSELHLLSTGNTDGLEPIALAKQSLIEKLGEQEASLIDLFESRPQDSRVSVLSKRMVQCRTDNRNNHALVLMELKHANKSLELLRSVLNMDDLSLYSERGEVRVNREKRNIGSA